MGCGWGSGVETAEPEGKFPHWEYGGGGRGGGGVVSQLPPKPGWVSRQDSRALSHPTRVLLSSSHRRGPVPCGISASHNPGTGGCALGPGMSPGVSPWGAMESEGSGRKAREGTERGSRPGSSTLVPDLFQYDCH